MNISGVHGFVSFTLMLLPQKHGKTDLLKGIAIVLFSPLSSWLNENET